MKMIKKIFHSAKLLTRLTMGRIGFGAMRGAATGARIGATLEALGGLLD